MITTSDHRIVYLDIELRVSRMRLDMQKVTKYLFNKVGEIPICHKMYEMTREVVVNLFESSSLLT